MRIQSDGKKLKDSDGRERIFHGINLVDKGCTVNNQRLFRMFDESTIEWIWNQGFNLIRFGVNWSNIEPEMNVYDETYLSWMDSIINACSKKGIYVYIDMHQDLYYEGYSDGAPKWALLDEGQAHSEGETWSDAYLLSQSVQTAFDNFFRDQEIEGTTIITQFAKMWRLIAERYHKNDYVMGYDLFNEPFPGTKGPEIFGALLGGYAQITGKELSEEKVFGLFSNEASKMQLLEEMDNYQLYMAVVSEVGQLIEAFDRGLLTDFYSKVTQAIEKVSEKLIFTENQYFSNMGLESKIGKVSDQQVYSPHGYDLVVDSPAQSLASNNRIDVIFDQHKKVQDRLEVPVIVGEWGAHYSHSKGLSHIIHILDKFDQNLWSHTYWGYDEEQKNSAVMKVLKRSYPQAVSGEIMSYKSSNKSFELHWENQPGITEVYIHDEQATVICEEKFVIKNKFLMIESNTIGPLSVHIKF